MYIAKATLKSFEEGTVQVPSADSRQIKRISNYEKYIGEQKEEITNLLGENIKIITLDDNYSFKSIISSADKVRGIGNILMIIFLAVTLLVFHC